jgi:hypothetical protein
MNRPTVRQFTLVFLLALASASPLAKNVWTTPAAPASWLFVEDAAGGTITGPDDQHLKLKLNKVRKYITEFTDRPNRQAYAMPNADFFTDWPQMFAGDPPNAVLSYSLPGQQQPLNIVLTITNPQYDAIKRTVSYDAVRILQATDIYLDIPDLAPFQTHKTPQRFGKASLFIDSRSTTTYKVGDVGPGGGIVFYLTPGTNGKQGLEAASVDQSSGIQWGCYGTVVGGTSEAIGTGLANTTAIIKACGTATAAGIADSYISQTGVSGWYLPSLGELNQLYEQYTVVGGFANNAYWSSTEGDSNGAWSRFFDSGLQYVYYKFYPLYVRAVRAF